MKGITGKSFQNCILKHLNVIYAMHLNQAMSIDSKDTNAIETKSPAERESIRALLHDIKEGKTPPSAKPQNLKGVVLSEEDLSGMDLSGVDFSGADLSGIKLAGARLFGTKFIGTILINADLSNCELSGADLTNANLENVNAGQVGLGMATLRGARMFLANLEGATLSKADLNEADLRCVCLRNARIREADMSDADFTGSDLREADLALCKVVGANFKDVDMRGASLRAIEGFEKAEWIGVDIRDINFAGAYALRRFVVDQNYLKEFRERSRFAKLVYWLWRITSDCGRSLSRWCFWITLQLLLFAGLFKLVGLDYGDHPTPLSPLYYSVVTLTTLGYGDIVPSSLAGQVIAMIEVVTGYVMLGGLLSIFSNKMARRGD
jgi:uncharacterized protein YjbI with pentapeptide repeats